MFPLALVLGMGRSGVAAAALLQSLGYQTTVLDEGVGSASSDMRDRLRRLGVQILEHQKSIPRQSFDVTVVSPGIALDHPLVVAAQFACPEVISELELGYRYCECPLLAVTGTNGKSTLVALLDQMLRQRGLRSRAGGNLGTPLCELVFESRTLDWIVVEVSSFQLELVRHFRPHGAVLLNVQPDHLDRHHTMEQYFKLKCRLFEQMGRGNAAVVQDALLSAVQHEVACFSHTGPDWISFGDKAGMWRYDADAHAIVGPCVGGRHAPVCVSVRDTYFDNGVTGQTAAAAVGLLSGDSDCTYACMERAIALFSPLPHRTEIVGDVDGVRYIDDSKATNIASLCAAVSMQNRPVHLIAGGILKEKDVFVAKQVLIKHVSCVYLIGDAASYLEQAWGQDVLVMVCGTLEKAMEVIFNRVQSGDVVLLSPGCASFDQFGSYAERGTRFANIVAAREQEKTRSI